MKISDLRALLDGQAVAREIEDIRDTAVKYVVEETVDPVKALGRYTWFGCLGSLFIGLGGILLLVGMLRGLAHVFHGTVSFIPYLLAAGLSVGGIVVTVKIISGGPARRRLTKKEKS